jgi:hypothetical protein
VSWSSGSRLGDLGLISGGRRKAECAKPYFEAVRRPPGVLAKLPSGRCGPPGRAGRAAAGPRQSIRFRPKTRSEDAYEAVFLACQPHGSRASEGRQLLRRGADRARAGRNPDWWLSVEKTKPAEFLETSEDRRGFRARSGSGPRLRILGIPGGRRRADGGRTPRHGSRSTLSTAACSLLDRSRRATG